MLIEALIEITEEELERSINNFKLEFEHDASQIYLLFDNEVPVSMARKAGKHLMEMLLILYILHLY